MMFFIDKSYGRTIYKPSHGYFKNMSQTANVIKMIHILRLGHTILQ